MPYEESWIRGGTKGPSTHWPRSLTSEVGKSASPWWNGYPHEVYEDIDLYAGQFDAPFSVLAPHFGVLVELHGGRVKVPGGKLGWCGREHPGSSKGRAFVLDFSTEGGVPTKEEEEGAGHFRSVGRK